MRSVSAWCQRRQGGARALLATAPRLLARHPPKTRTCTSGAGPPASVEQAATRASTCALFQARSTQHAARSTATVVGRTSVKPLALARIRLHVQLASANACQQACWQPKAIRLLASTLRRNLHSRSLPRSCSRAAASRAAPARRRRNVRHRLRAAASWVRQRTASRIACARARVVTAARAWSSYGRAMQPAGTRSCAPRTEWRHLVSARTASG
jgi:hypothetical protein